MNFINKSILVLVLFIYTLSSCQKDNTTNPSDTVEINITSPSEGTSFNFGDTVNVVASISAATEMHGYAWTLINKADSTVLASGESGEVHSKSYDIAEKWVNNVTTTVQALLTISAEATHEEFVEKMVNITLKPMSQSGTVQIVFTNNVGNVPLVLNTAWYKNAHNDSFQVSMFKYYISNIKLNKSGSNFTEAESYHLLNHADATSLSFNLNDVPMGTYNSITFTIGVDSFRNVSGAQTGALDPANGMFWSWNSGYIMMKFEGISPQSTQTGNVLKYHIGGFSGVNNTVKTVTLNLPQSITVDANSKKIKLSANILALFSNPNTINFSTMSSVQMPGVESKMLADNYANMFTVTGVE